MRRRGSGFGSAVSRFRRSEMAAGGCRRAVWRNLIGRSASCAALFAGLLAAQTAPRPVALVGGTLVDGTGSPPVRDAVVVMRDGRIACAGTRTACAPSSGTDTVSVEIGRASWRDSAEISVV